MIVKLANGTQIIKERIKRWFKKDKYILLAALAIGLLVTGFTGYYSKQYADTIQGGLSENLIRFHVIANSDDPADQDLKRAVRDEIIAHMKGILDQAHNIEESRVLIQTHIEDITTIANKVIQAWGKDYPVKVSLGPANFPTKQYGDIVLPTGEYEALRVEIGAAKGQNWWCVMFPPLCFVDITHGVVPEDTKEELKNVLTEEEYNIVLTTKTEKELPIKIRFKIVEWWQQKSMETKHMFAKFMSKE